MSRLGHTFGRQVKHGYRAAASGNGYEQIPTESYSLFNIPRPDIVSHGIAIRRYSGEQAEFCACGV